MSYVYASNYIKRAITSKVIEPPEPSQSNGQTDILQSIYMAHKANGIKGALAAWETIKTLKPAEAALLAQHSSELMCHADELKHLSKPGYVMEDYPIYEKGFNALIGPSGGGKSFVALDIAARLSLKDTVIYNAGEGLSGYASRWEVWKHHHKIDTGNLHFYKEPVQIIDDQQRSTMIELLKPMKPILLVIDTMARAAVGIEENSAKEIGVFVEACAIIQRELDCGILLVHHTGKDGKYRGSSALFGACDSIINLTNSDGLIELHNNPDMGGKNKHFESAPTRRLKLLPIEAGEFQSAVLIDASSMVVDPTINRSLTNTQRIIIEAVDGYENGMGTRAIIEATNLSQAAVYKNLKLLVKSGFLKRDDRELYIVTEEGQEALVW
jgi:predicted transcriptional regulator